MQINEAIIPAIEAALGLKLFPWQREWLVNGTQFPDICPCLLDLPDKQNIRRDCEYRFDGKRCYARNRRTGRTLVHCINLALGDGEDYVVANERPGCIRVKGIEPIDTLRMELYCDYGDGSLRYAQGYYRRMFLDVWCRLKDAGLPVREVRI
ncbi:MAG: hypothetical protein HPY66_1666 [Firmicutes bacterium]|nr:hypothetical protein [Bacillota bacterium]